MWQPAAGSDPRLDELAARVRKQREEVQAMLAEIDKHLEYIEALLHDLDKRTR